MGVARCQSRIPQSSTWWWRGFFVVSCFVLARSIFFFVRFIKGLSIALVCLEGCSPSNQKFGLVGELLPFWAEPWFAWRAAAMLDRTLVCLEVRRRSKQKFGLLGGLLSCYTNNSKLLHLVLPNPQRHCSVVQRRHA